MSLQKKLILLAALFISLQLPKAQGLFGIKRTSEISNSTKTDYLSSSHISLTDSLVNYGKLFLNTPYRYGSNGTSSFDCSGFTSYVYRNFGYNLQRSSCNQAQQFDTVHRNNLHSGDLVFFSGRRGSSQVGHVGIVTDAKDDGNFNFIHASVGLGVTISCSDESYYSNRFIKANRVISDNLMLESAANALSERKHKDQMSIPTLSNSSARQTKKTIPALYHRVKSGETLSSISDTYGISMAELIEKNHIKEGKIKRRHRLKIRDKEVIMIDESVQLADTKSIDTSRTFVSSKQENLVSKASLSSSRIHIVKKGETLFGISNLYDITIEDLMRINDIKKKSLRPGQELKLNRTFDNSNPVAVDEIESSTKTTTSHKVLTGETLSSISKLYKISIKDLRKINNIKTANILPGQELKLYPAIETSNTANNVSPVVKQEETSKTINYRVKNGESLYSISQDYNIPIDEIKKLNNLTSSKIHSGQKLNLTQRSQKSKSNSVPANQITHKISTGESFYSIAKTYGCTVDNLKEWNNKTDNKLIPGDKLIIQSKTL